MKLHTRGGGSGCNCVRVETSFVTQVGITAVPALERSLVLARHTHLQCRERV